MELMTVEEFKRDATKNKEKYVGHAVVVQQKDGKFLVGIIRDVDEKGLKIKPLFLFERFDVAMEFAKMLEEMEEKPSYIM